MRSLLVALALLAPAAGLACSCVRPTIERRVIPPDGSTAVPIDAAVRVYLTGGLPANIRAGLRGAYRLVGPEGPVETTTRLVRTRLDLQPKAPLTPRTAYRIEQLFAYDTDGVRVDDMERLRLAFDGGWVATRRWYPVATFTTGTARASAPPIPAAIEASASFRRGGGDCGPGSSVGATYTAAPDPLIAVELHVEGHGVVATTPMAPRGPRIYAADTLCTPDKISLGKGPFTVQVAFVGPGGQRTLSPAVRTEGAGLLWRAPRPQPAPQAAWAELWFRGAIKPTPPNTARGPASCPAGLEAAASRRASRDGGRTSYGDRNALARIGRSTEAVVIRDAALVRVDAQGGAHVIERPATSVRATPLDAGTVLVMSNHTRDAVPLIAIALDGAGTQRWRTLLAPDQLNWKARIAACGARVAVVWERIVDRRYGEARLHWALLDAQSGAIRARSAAGLAMEGEGTALGCGADGAPWLVGRRDGRPRGLVLARFTHDRVSPLQPLPARLRATTAALAPHPKGALLLTDQQGIEAAVIDARGALQGAVVRLAQAGRKPAIVPHGAGWIAAWEAYPAWQAWVTVFDGAGQVAQPTQIGEGWGTVGLTAQGDQVDLVATGPQRSVEIARLRCRAQPSDRAPARLP